LSLQPFTDTRGYKFKRSFYFNTSKSASTKTVIVEDVLQADWLYFFFVEV